MVKQECRRMWPVFMLLLDRKDWIVRTALVSMNKNLGVESLRS